MMLTFLLAGFAVLVASTLALNVYSRVAYCEYLIFTTCTDEQLPKHIFPLAYRRDYRRIYVGSKNRQHITTTAFVSNILISLSSTLLLVIMVMFSAPIGTVIVAAFGLLVFNAFLWLLVSWGMPEDLNTIYL